MWKKENFIIERQNRIARANDTISRLMSLVGTNDKYDSDYAKYADLKDRLDLCTYDKRKMLF